MKQRREKVQRGFFLAAVLGLVVLSGCGPVISSEFRNEARKDLTFSMAFSDPAAYTGSVVIWGGVIIGIMNQPEGTTLVVLETPLSYRERPETSDRSRGRFIAETPQFLDPAMFSTGRKVTIAGAITGKETMPLGKAKVPYTYPVIRIKQIYLWSMQPEYMPPPGYWYMGGPYGYWPYGWPYEGFENGGEREEGEHFRGEHEEREHGGREHEERDHD